MVDLRITGANQLSDLARDLKKEANGKELRKDLLRGMQRAGKPLKAIAKEAALERLPHTGGLNEFVAASTFSIRTRTSGRNVGVRLTGAKKGHDIKATDRGRLRHPVFGHTDRWVLQVIPPGWFTDAPQLTDAAVLGSMQRELIQVLDDVVRRIASD